MKTIIGARTIVKRNRVRLLLHWNTYASECDICFETKGPFHIFHDTCAICKSCKPKLRYTDRCFTCLKELNVNEMKCLYGYLHLAKPMEKIKECPSCNIKIQKNGGCNHMTCPCGHEFEWETSDDTDSDDFDF